jgi:amidophosphoribosyltransferase
MGVDMGTSEELISSRLSVAELCEHIGADSLQFLSLEAMMKAVGRDDGYCHGCYTGSYPIDIGRSGSKLGFEGALA